MNESLKELMDTVVENDYCIGCGICASLSGSPLTMKLDDYGKFRPFIVESNNNENMDVNPLSVCPFSKENNKETEIGEDIFGGLENIQFNKHTGYYIKNYAGYVKEGDFRKKGSSGGMGNWIATQLLSHDLVDGIIHVKSAADKDDVLFEYQISYNSGELLKGAKSKYYPIELSQVMKFVKENEGKYAIIGIPCYIKGVRLLTEQDALIKSRIKFFIGLVCGHLKSDMFAKSMSWQLGIEPKYLKGIDFRKELEGRSANDYGVEVVGLQRGKSVKLSSPKSDLYTTNWGHGFFKYNACEFCDDVLAETADVTVGDAWLPEFSKDSMGTNVIVVRNPIIKKIFDESKIDSIFIKEISDEKVYQSQAGGFRHRREGLSYRLYLKDSKKQWRPQKRVEPRDNLSFKRKRIYEERTALSQASFEAFKIALQKGDFNEFKTYMDPLVKNYNNIADPSIIKRILRKIRREVRKVIKS